MNHEAVVGKTLDESLPSGDCLPSNGVIVVSKNLFTIFVSK